MALSKIQTGLVDTNAIGATELNLADNFAFTGKLSGSTWELIDQRIDDTSASSINYDSDTTILDWSSYISTYNTFAFHVTYYVDASSGSQHLYFNVGALMRFVNNGYTQTSQVATPAVGTGGYYRWAFQAQNATRASCTGFIFNGQRSDATMDTMITTQSGWYYEGVGATSANGTSYVDNSAQITTLRLNNDQATSGGGTSGWVNAKLWGIQ